jgi:hypothetical protein
VHGARTITIVSGRFSLKQVNVAAMRKFLRGTAKLFCSAKRIDSSTPSSARFGHTFPSQRQCPAGQFDTTQVFTHSALTGVI